MRHDQQLYLADLVRQHREQVQRTLAELVERDEPVGPLESRLLLDAMDVRLLQVENALRYDPDHQLGRGAGAWARIRAWVRPRLGVLRHYRPRELRVPVSYLKTRPPRPAPTISIVTPSFQQGRFLARTIHSVLSQGYPALEYVVQDGGSTDETLDVLARFDGGVGSCVSEPDAGQADAINRGFARTSGEIMAWLNSDDVLLPGALAYVGAYFASHPEVDVVYGHRIMIDEEDGQIGAWILPRHDDAALALADYVPQEGLFWRRRVWETAGGYVDTSFRFALDWELLLRFASSGARIERLPRFLGGFRVHQGQKTHAIDQVGEEEMARLRIRTHGRPVSVSEVKRRLRGYYLRHIWLHTLQRLVDRLPLRRVAVSFWPPELVGTGSTAAAEWETAPQLTPSTDGPFRSR